MARLKKIGKWLGITVAVLLVVGGCFYGWASWKSGAMFEEIHATHEVDFPIPFALTDEEIEALREERRAEALEAEPPAIEASGEVPAEAPVPEAEPEPEVDPLEGVDLDALALERAQARGRHLVEARYACIECHGDDFSGGVMVDDPAIGTLLGPNLTGGNGSRVSEWTAAQWDQAVRHGILPGGRASAMPAEDYQRMSDQELSDIIVYIRSFPAVDNQTAPPSFGPLGTVLFALGEIPLSAGKVDHEAAHPELPPEVANTVEFGKHLAGVCTGCHRATFEGGPVPGGPPDWLPASNITPHEDGLAGWEYDDFVVAMREMKRPDGSSLGAPMTLMERYTAKMTDTELRALWTYIQSVEPRPTGT